MRWPIASGRGWARLPATQARGHFLSHTAGGFVLKVAVTGLFFVASVALARLLGAEGYGAYTYALTWSGLLGLLASLGLGQLVTRSMAAYQAQADWGRVKGLLIWAHGTTLAASLGLALLGALAAWLWRGASDQATLLALALALLLLPLTTLLRLQQSTLRGFGHVILSQLPESLIQPLLLLVIVGGLWLGLPAGLSAPWAMAANGTATLGALGIAALLVVRRSPQIPAGTTAVYAGRAWLRSALPLLSISALVMVNSRAVILLLGAMAGVESVALYNVAARGAEILSFVLVPTELALQPRIARLYALGDRAALQEIVRQGARVMALLALPLVIGLLIFGGQFLRLFGPEFAGARPALSILLAGHLCDVLAGPVVIILTMTGHEGDAAKAIGLSTALNLLLAPPLIHVWGLEGAALATAVSLSLWNVLLVFLVRRRVGIDSTLSGKAAPMRSDPRTIQA